ncbi:MAG TPA: hypothetical protein VMW27_12755 [Thermoanaerobaculia bacterium]|nr:hypothetical protein [Thermoanaerobaculia bacterium]
MTCPKCGNVQLLSMVCTRCGAAMGDDPSPSPVLKPGFGPGPSLGIGEILETTFSLFFKNLSFFVVLMILAFSPLLLLFVALQTAPAEAWLFGSLRYVAVALSPFVEILCGSFTTALFTDAVFQLLRGEEASLGRSLRTGFGSFLPVLGLALIYALAAIVGFVLCIIPGLIFMTMYAAAVPALVIERVGPIDAMTRSARLTAGYRWPLFGALFVLWCIDAGIDLLVILGLGRPGSRGEVNGLIKPLLGLIPAGLYAITSVLAYHRLRGIKEAFGLVKTTSVFD